VSTQLLAEAGSTLQPHQLTSSLEALLAYLGPVLVSGAPRHSRAVVAGLERLMPAVARLLGQQVSRMCQLCMNRHVLVLLMHQWLDGLWKLALLPSHAMPRVWCRK
jgi:hypothetical protein